MVKVTDIKIVELSFDSKKNDKRFIQIIKNIEYLGYESNMFIPQGSKYSVDFILSDTFSGFANTIRRSIIGESLVKCLTLVNNGMKSSDAYILIDALNKNINALRINQDYSLEELEKLNISISVENKTDKNILVTSRDIVILDKDGKNIPTDKYWSHTVPLTYLRSYKFLKIEKLNVIEGTSFKDSSGFSAISNFRYDIIVDKINQDKSSLEYNSSKFKLGYTTYRNSTINPKSLILNCCSLYINKLLKIMEELNLVNEDDSKEEDLTKSHFSDLLNITTEKQMTKFQFNNEFWTISNLLSQQIYILFPDIKFVTPGIQHPSIHVGIVNIVHVDPLKIMILAIEKSIAEFESVKKYFSNI